MPAASVHALEHRLRAQVPVGAVVLQPVVGMPSARPSGAAAQHLDRARAADLGLRRRRSRGSPRRGPRRRPQRPAAARAGAGLPASARGAPPAGSPAAATGRRRRSTAPAGEAAEPSPKWRRIPRGGSGRPRPRHGAVLAPARLRPLLRGGAAARERAGVHSPEIRPATRSGAEATAARCPCARGGRRCLRFSSSPAASERKPAGTS